MLTSLHIHRVSLVLAAFAVCSTASGKGLELTPMGLVEPARAVTIAPETPPTPAVALPVTNAAPADTPSVQPSVAASTPAAPAVSAVVPVGPAIQAAPASTSTWAPAPAPGPSPAALPDHRRLTGDLAVSPNPVRSSVGASVDLTAAAPTDPVVEVDHPPVEQVWTVPDHGTLRDVIEAWGQRAGWRVKWDTDLNYPMEASFEVRGDFLQAADQVFAAYWDAKEKFAVSSHPNNVLFVRQMGKAAK